MIQPAAIPILLYHKIGASAPLGTASRSLSVPTERFRSQMWWLKTFGYRGLSVADLQPYLSGEKSGRVFGLTFDDGYQNVLRNAAPILDQLSFTATNYFVSGQVGGSNEWDVHKNIPRIPLMSVKEMREWTSLGHEAGAHTISHPNLTQLSKADARHEIADCKHSIEDAVGSTVDAFCYPHGAYNDYICSLVEGAGYLTATTTIKRRAMANDNKFALPRITIRRADFGVKALMKSLFS